MRAVRGVQARLAILLGGGAKRRLRNRDFRRFLKRGERIVNRILNLGGLEISERSGRHHQKRSQRKNAFLPSASLRFLLISFIRPRHSYSPSPQVNFQYPTKNCHPE